MSTIIGDGVVRVDGKVVFGPSPYVIRACRPLVEGWQGPVLVYVGAPFEVYVPAVLLGSDPKYPDRWLVWRDASDWPDTEASLLPEETAVRSVELGDLRLDLGCPTVCDRWDRVRLPNQTSRSFFVCLGRKGVAASATARHDTAIDAPVQAFYALASTAEDYRGTHVPGLAVLEPAFAGVEWWAVSSSVALQARVIVEQSGVFEAASCGGAA